MRTLLLIFLALLSAAFSPASMLPAPPAADAIVGRWLTADKAGVVQIYEQQGAYAGKIVGPNAPRLDTHNPDPDLRRRPLLGVVILQGFRHTAAGSWEDGTIYDPKNGKTYSCILRLASATALEVRGYIGLSLFGRTETWTRQP